MTRSALPLAPGWLTSPTRGGRRRARRPGELSRRPCLEAMEGRRLLSTVTSLADAGPGSLREAIAITPAGGTVDFQPGLTGTITLTTGQLTIAKDLTISGPGAAVITVSGNNATRVFEVDAVRAAISGLTITGGRTSGNGGGILNNEGNLKIAASQISGNSASFGGGLLNRGTMTISTCTISGNSGAVGGGLTNAGTVSIAASTISGNSANLGGGGGIYNDYRSTATIAASTISGNSANHGGGLFNFEAMVTIAASTISGNSATQSVGGGLYNVGTVSIAASTISGNSATRSGGGLLNFAGTVTIVASTLVGNSAQGDRDGGGIANDRGPVTVRNTILAGNNAPSGLDVRGTLESLGHNLIGIGAGGSGYAPTDLIGTAASPLDPLLQPLGNYGGPTQTMRPLPWSPVINAGDNALAGATDQRGLPQIVLGYVDIGAVELQPSEFAGPAASAVAAAVAEPVRAPLGWPVEAAEEAGRAFIPRRRWAPMSRWSG